MVDLGRYLTVSLIEDSCFWNFFFQVFDNGKHLDRKKMNYIIYLLKC